MRLPLTAYDGGHEPTRLDYDALGRLVKVTENYRPGEPQNPLTNDVNVETDYRYDSHGNRLAILDANLHQTTFTYDALDRLKTETDAEANTTEYRYDKAGLQRGLVDANHQGTSVETTYDYDGLRRLETIDYPDDTPDVAFDYDASGNRT